MALTTNIHQINAATVVAGTPYDGIGNYNVGVKHVVINQVYGGGNNKGAGSHGFIELYNPTDEEVDIQPRIFSNEVQIQNYQQLKSLEIYRADGKLIRSVPQPGSSLSTGDFATGMYIFRLTTEKGSQTVQGIKK